MYQFQILSATTGGATTVTVTGGVATTNGPYTVRTFATSDNLTIIGGELNFSFIMVGGGGGGGSTPSAGGAGGGAGGVVRGTTTEGAGTWSITIGQGGAGGTQSPTTPKGVNGGNTVFALSATQTALGGGGGGGGNVSSYNAT